MLINITYVIFEVVNIILNERLTSFVKEKIATGNYNSSEDVVKEALRLLKEQDDKKLILKAEIQKGIDSIAAGRYTTQTMEEIFDEAIDKYDEANNKQ